MSYRYADYQTWLTTPDAKEAIRKTMAKARPLLAESGCVMACKIMVATDSWQSLACLDYLCEIGFMREVKQAGAHAGQHRVFAESFE